MDQQRFVQLLESVLTPDTDRVKAATSTLRKDYYTSPESLSLLLQLLTSHDSPQLRQLAATQARSLVPKHWNSIPNPQKPEIRNRLLQATLSESAALVRHSAARVISAIAKIDIEDGEWIDLPGLMQHAAVSSNVQQREVSTYILFTILESMGDGFMHRFQELFTLFSKTIKDPESSEVRINTMLALGKMAMFIDVDNDEESLDAFQRAIPDMVAVLKQSINDGDEDRTMQAFEIVQTLLGCESKLLNKHFGDLIHFMLELAAEQSGDDDTRTQALSFLMQAVTYRKLKVQGLKLGEQLTLKSLEIVTEFGDASPEDEDVTPARSALALLDLLSTSLPPSQVVVPLLHALSAYVNSPDPDRRQAGIMALGTCVEGAPDFVGTQLQEILPLVLRLLNDPELKVRDAALSAVARLSDELAEDLGKEHGRLIPALANNLERAVQGLSGPHAKENMGVIKRCCNAIDSLVEGLEPEDIQQYLPGLISHLSQLFSLPDLGIKAASIAAVGSIAVNAEDGFLPYFEQTMNSLSEYVRIKDSDDELTLRCTTCDSMGNMAVAVGPKPFLRYVKPLMDATEEGLNLGNPKLRETSYIFWGTMAKVYEKEFKPFLPGVVQGLIQSLEQEETDMEVELGEAASDLVGQEVIIAGKKVKVASAKDDDELIADDTTLVDGDDGDEDDWDEVTTVTAIALEKEIALEALATIITSTQEEYLPYLEKSIEITLSLVEHAYEGTRRAAIGALYRAYATLWEMQGEKMEKWKPGLPIQIQPSSEVMKLGAIIMTATLAMWQDEEDRATVTDINRNIAETLKLCGPAILAGDNVLEQVTTVIVSIITKKHPCQQDFGDGEDLDNLEESSEYDWLVIDTALDVVISLAAALGEQFGQLWKIFEKPILQYASSSDHYERSTAVGTIAECIRGMGSAVTPYTTGLLKILLHRMSDEDTETKSNAAFAVGVLQENTTKDQEILKSFNIILTKLEPLLHTEEARALDNAAGCVSRMIMKHRDHMPVSEVLPALLGLLPLKQDFEENDPVYRMIVQLYSQGEPTIIGLTPRIIPILEQVMSPPERQLLDGTREQLVELVTFIYNKHPALIRQHPVLMAAIQA